MLNKKYWGYILLIGIISAGSITNRAKHIRSYHKRRIKMSYSYDEQNLKITNIIEKETLSNSETINPYTERFTKQRTRYNKLSLKSGVYHLYYLIIDELELSDDVIVHLYSTHVYKAKSSEDCSKYNSRAIVHTMLPKASSEIDNEAEFAKHISYQHCGW